MGSTRIVPLCCTGIPAWQESSPCFLQTHSASISNGLDNCRMSQRSMMIGSMQLANSRNGECCRSTTTYLVQRRIDMLPKALTEDICSLRGGVERLAFSVIWEMTPQANAVSVRSARCTDHNVAEPSPQISISSKHSHHIVFMFADDHVN